MIICAQDDVDGGKSSKTKTSKKDAKNKNLATYKIAVKTGDKKKSGTTAKVKQTIVFIT